MELNKVRIYRITHIENIPHILQYGITHKDSQNKNNKFKNIGDISLIDTRHKKHVSIDNGDINLKNSFDTIKLSDYIPFYFGVKMPMLYVAQHGGNFVETATPPNHIIYLKCSLSKLISSNIPFYFTDGHATDMLTSFYDSKQINKLSDIIDWEAVQSPYWGGSENLNIKRKKQAELLVKGDLTPDLIIGFGCYNEQAKQNLISFGITENKIKVVPDLYY